MSTNKYFHHDSNRGILKTTSVLSLGTLSSRILGFVRDMILATFLGTSFRADAFFVAFRIPNLFRDILGEGGMNSAVVPVIAEYAQKDKQDMLVFLNAIFILLLCALSFLTILGIVFAPIIVRVIAPGFVEDAEKLRLTITLTRLIFPYLIFIGLTAYGMGVLFVFRSFAIPAFSPCLLNLAVIASAVLARFTSFDQTICLALGVLCGGVLQLGVHVIPILRRGIYLSFPKTLNHPGLHKVGRLILPRLFGSGVYQLSVFVDTFCASLSSVVGAGGISAIYYANRVLQFPMSIFGVAIASAILPTLSGFAARSNAQEFQRTLVFALKSILLVMMPVAVFLVLFAVPIVRLLFERGAFDAYSTTITAQALLFFSLGLFWFAGAKVLVTAFHSLQDTATPAKVAALCLVANIALNFILMGPLQVGGIALASAIASGINFFVLLHVLGDRLQGFSDGLVEYASKIFLSSIMMGGVCFILWHLLGMAQELVRLMIVFAAGVVVFFHMCALFKIQQAQQVLAWISKKS